MDVPKNLRYAKSHEWASEPEDGVVTVGITDFAQDQLGDVVYVELPETGEHVDAEQPVAVVESVKTGLETVDLAEIEGQEVEEQRPLVLGRQRDHLALGLTGDRRVDLLEVRGLAREARAVIDDLEVDLAGREVDRAHDVVSGPNRPSSSASVASDQASSKSSSGASP